MSEPIRAYLKAIEQALKAGNATEHTHRPALKTLLETLMPGITATNEPRRIECGAPDFIITQANTPIGYIEAKDVGASLSAEQRSEQMGRYRDSLNNLILTDYLEFRWYVQGEHRDTVRLAAVTKDGKVKRAKGGAQAVVDLFQRFLSHQVPTLGQPRELAERMAALARMTRDLIKETFQQEAEQGTLHAQLRAFRETLIPGLTPAQFADMYAQTITYGLFAARIRVPSGHDFAREKAAWNLPKTNPFLRRLFNEIAGPGLDERIAWLVDDLAYLLARADMAEVLRDFGKRTRQEDPVVHFYETFLTAYDPQMRKTRGVYYTPEPVVSYIVHSLDHILKTRFGRSLGLADQHTLILDPAVGTATFLYFVIQHIHEAFSTMGQAGVWSSYVKDYLLPRVFGFELLMAPYAVAHMKLGVQLQQTGYDFAADQRLGIYLTNSLEEAITQAETLGFAGYITTEANAAAEVKRDKPIMVVLGNPPYSVSSANKGDRIEHLMERYKTAVRGERNIQPLSDDYIKFIRFAHDRIERTGYGVIGMITNHTYLSGLIHRGMREELMKTFDEIYLLNLHGNALLGETAPDGGPDENVFDIRQGVAIMLAVKQPAGAPETSRVYYADLWGQREGKYRYLLENDISTTEWQALEAESTTYFFFVPKVLDCQKEYEKGWSTPDVFPMNVSGFVTHRDRFAIDLNEECLRSRIVAFRDEALSDDEVKEQFGLKDTRDWKLSEARKSLQHDERWEDRFVDCFYRPFDTRPTYYSSTVVEYPRPRVMRHMLKENVALLTCRQQIEVGFRHILCSSVPTERCAISLRTRELTYVFPLYLYTTPEDTKVTLFVTQEVTREPNLSQQFISAVKGKLGLNFVPDGKGDLQSTFGPEDIFHYAYAVFHSPTYRERYAEFLKIDFPRLPLTSDLILFEILAEKGEELAALHLMKSPALEPGRFITQFPKDGSNEVASRHLRYLAPGEPEPGTGKSVEQGRVYINKVQYFGGIDPDVWAFQIGGYQVLHKWLKDRKGRTLSFEDVLHYQKMIVALQETMRLMAEIDEAIPDWPIQ